MLHRPSDLEPREIALGLKTGDCCVPAPPVIEFDQAGNVLQSWGEGYEWLVKAPTTQGVFVDDNDNVWISGGGHLVTKFTRTGTLLLQIGQRDKTGGSNDRTLLGRPAGVFVDAAANEVYVADGYVNRRVIVFDATTGAYKRHWGGHGNRPQDPPKEEPFDPSAPDRQQFAPAVHCAAVSRDGLVYVCDRGNKRIQVFRKDGTYVNQLFVRKATGDLDYGPSNVTGSGPVCDVTFSRDADQQFLYIGDCANSKIHIVSRKSLTIVGAFGRLGRRAGELFGPHFVATDSKGNLYVAEVYGRRVQKFDFKGLK